MAGEHVPQDIIDLIKELEKRVKELERLVALIPK